MGVYCTFISPRTRALCDEYLWLVGDIYFSSLSFRALDDLELMCLTSLVILSACLVIKRQYIVLSTEYIQTSR